MKSFSRQYKGLLVPACIGLGLCGLHSRAEAQLDFHVDLNTSSLAGGSFFVDFALNDGHFGSSGTADGNNTAVVNSFNLGGGTAGAILPPTLGSATGTIATGFTLVDSDPGGVADIAQGFTAGSKLDFDVHLTTNVDAGGTPDQFLFRILDSTGATIATNDPSGNDGFIDILLNSPTITVNDVTSFSSSTPPLTPPTITNLNTVPEPGTLALLIGGLCSGSAFAFRRRQRR